MQSLCVFIRALETPRVTRPCSGCSRLSTFVCSERFRVNAQQKSLDVWLIYRCEECKTTWNLTVHSRVNPRQLPSEDLNAYMANNQGMAWKVAFDRVLIERAGGHINLNVPVELEKSPATGEDLLLIRSPYPVGIRLDRVLSQLLSLSRSSVQKMAKAGEFDFGKEKAKRILRRPIHDGQTIGLILK